VRREDRGDVGPRFMDLLDQLGDPRGHHEEVLSLALPGVPERVGMARRANTADPGEASISSSPSRKPSVPDRTYHASSSPRWTWSGAIQWSPTSAVHWTITKSSPNEPRALPARFWTYTLRIIHAGPLGTFPNSGATERHGLVKLVRPNRASYARASSVVRNIAAAPDTIFCLSAPD